jgi:molybdopterin-guanine dinucleotide biosynthesis protein A
MTKKAKHINITGVILAGGKSSRMGRDKALLNLNGKSFIQHIGETLKNNFNEVIIITDQVEMYRFMCLPIYEDVFKDRGPLGGIHSAFMHSHLDKLFIVSTDLPLINSASIHYLLSRESQGDSIVFSVGDKIQPLFGLYNRTCFPTIENHLERNQSSVVNLLKDINAMIIPAPVSSALNISHTLKNINTPEEYWEINRLRPQRNTL